MNQTKNIVPANPDIATVVVFKDQIGRFPRMATEPDLVRNYLLALAS